MALRAGPRRGNTGNIIVAASFSVLSLLPAVLLHISLYPDNRLIWISGYVLSAAAVGLHVADLATPQASFHLNALLVVAVGFAALTTVSVLLEPRQRNRSAPSRLIDSMALFLFAISFAHFGSIHAQQAWSKDRALQPRGDSAGSVRTPAELPVLIARCTSAIRRQRQSCGGRGARLIRILQSGEYRTLRAHPFDAGLMFAGACLLLALFVYVRIGIQQWLTRVVFLRVECE